VLRLVEVVGGEQHGRAGVPQPGDEVPEGAARLGVEARGGLVEEQQLGGPDDPQGDVEPAPLPAGELAGAGAGLVGEPDSGDHLVRVAGTGVVARVVVHELVDGQLRLVGGALQHDADPGAPGPSGGARVLPEHADLAGVPGAEPLEDLDRGGLPGPVGAQDCDDLAALHGQVQAVDGALGAVVLVQPAHEDGGLGGRGHGISLAAPPALR
jgi:hypothetical protein